MMKDECRMMNESAKSKNQNAERRMKKDKKIEIV